MGLPGAGHPLVELPAKGRSGAPISRISPRSGECPSPLPQGVGFPPRQRFARAPCTPGRGRTVWSFPTSLQHSAPTLN